uniref:Olfactory receptor n=1 Tax=Leptobrachium leishanense TaxID=445787 RepID=A0A8C5R4X4_9ANUR
MQNQTIISEFYLTGLSDLLVTQLLAFLLFLCIYMMTLTGNLLIILLVLLDSRLHFPMYFFLGNLACLDICCSSITTPRFLFDLNTKKRIITVSACIMQIYFFLFIAASEILLLAVMSYDRYIAICHPLHYTQIMHIKACLHLASGVWTLGMVYSMVHTLLTLRLTFCGSNIVHSFFCDLPKLLQISCTDTTLNVLSIFLVGGLIGFITNAGKLKAFSTCTSQLAVIIIFYGSLVFIYFVPTTSSFIALNKLVSVIYTVINPLLNPLIYSVRNKDLKEAIRRVLRHTSRMEAHNRC